jgi:hypothetical protein
MRTIYDENDDVLREVDIHDLLDEYKYEVMDLDRHDIDWNEWELMNSQFAYIKFGLILERFRNESWWNRCKEKFSDFKNFCERKINLNVWQANDAIASARSALRLAKIGFPELPRNASQALALSKLSLDRACDVWENICDKFAPHKITAAIIKQEIAPAAQPLKAKMMLPVDLVDRIHHEAAQRGLSVNDYLAESLFGEDTSPEPQGEPEPVDPVVDEIMDALDRKFKAHGSPSASAIDRPVEPKKIIEATAESFDRLMNDLIGQFIPSVRKVQA